MSNNEDDGKGGYGKPPKRFQWAKGQSGNPKGRPKNSSERVTFISQTAFKRLLIKTALEHVEITENGLRIAVPKIQAVIMQLTNKAMSGNIAASKLILQHFGDYTEKIDKQDNEWRLSWVELKEDVLKAMRHPGSLECYDVKYRYFMSKKNIRNFEGVDRWPFEDDEPLTDADWYTFMHIHEDLKTGRRDDGPWPPPYPSHAIPEEVMLLDDEDEEDRPLSDSDTDEQE